MNKRYTLTLGKKYRGRSGSLHHQISARHWELFCRQYLDDILPTFTYQEAILRVDGVDQGAYILSVVADSPTPVYEALMRFRDVFTDAVAYL